MSKTLGILPAAGLASRFGGIAKFTLPIPGSEGSFLGRHVRQLLPVVDEVVVATRSTLVELVSGILRYENLQPARVKGLSTETCSETIIRTISESGAEADTFVVGFPDAYIEAEDHYQRLRKAVRTCAVSVVLGIAPFESRMTGRLGQVSLEEERVVDIIDKDPGCPYRWVWGTVGFGRELIRYMRNEDPHIGYAVRAFIADGGTVVGLPCLIRYLDCGMPSDYFELIHRLVPNGAHR
jgi:hypothetical protein